MTTITINLDKPVRRTGQLPRGWWLLPSVMTGAGIWAAVLKVLFF
jgi:NO-binding membrane sensor protein with MHYT domain